MNPSSRFAKLKLQGEDLPNESSFYNFMSAAFPNINECLGMKPKKPFSHFSKTTITAEPSIKRKLSISKIDEISMNPKLIKKVFVLNDAYLPCISQICAPVCKIKDKPGDGDLGQHTTNPGPPDGTDTFIKIESDPRVIEVVDLSPTHIKKEPGIIEGNRLLDYVITDSDPENDILEGNSLYQCASTSINIIKSEPVYEYCTDMNMNEANLDFYDVKKELKTEPDESKIEDELEALREMTTMVVQPFFERVLPPAEVYQSFIKLCHQFNIIIDEVNHPSIGQWRHNLYIYMKSMLEKRFPMYSSSSQSVYTRATLEEYFKQFITFSKNGGFF